MPQNTRQEPPATNTDAPADPESVARTILLRRLTDQPRSRAELAGFLAKKHVPADIAEQVLDRFEEVGLIDDVDFARSWVQSRQRSRGVASKVLAMELRRKGVDAETAREVLAELDPDVERQNAHRLVQKKLRSMRGLDSTTQIRRLTGMLARKGYAPQVAFDVVRAELEAVEMQEPDSV